MKTRPTLEQLRGMAQLHEAAAAVYRKVGRHDLAEQADRRLRETRAFIAKVTR